MRVFVLTILAVFALSGVSHAMMELGKALPTDLALQDQNGELQNFDRIKGERGLVLVFVRSVDWCPYCQVQLLGLKDAADDIIAAGYNVATVSYDAPELLKGFATKYKFPHVMLSDGGSETIKAFGILNEDYNPDHFAYGVPHPTVYIVNADGFVQTILAEGGYKKRPQAEAILESLQ